MTRGTLTPSTARVVSSGLAARRSWGVGLRVVVTFNLLSAVGGGIVVAVTQWAGMPPSLIGRSPFC
jgi:hypothetical protein